MSSVCLTNLDFVLANGKIYVQILTITASVPSQLNYG
jgi:hypothetical protein